MEIATETELELEYLDIILKLFEIGSLVMMLVGSIDIADEGDRLTLHILTETILVLTIELTSDLEYLYHKSIGLPI